MPNPPRSRHWHEAHTGAIGARLNWLRAGVLGANDGIISTAALVVGVAAADADTDQIATAGVAGLVAGAISMGLGEYVSVSSQRDTEDAVIAKETEELERMPEAEEEELAGLLRQRGLSEQSSAEVASELMEHDPLGAHLSFELGIDQRALANPWAAAGSSALSFVLGAALPLVAVLAAPASARIAVTFVAVLVALCVTAVVSARLGEARPGPAVLRLVVGGALAMLVTLGIGELLGVAIG